MRTNNNGLTRKLKLTVLIGSASLVIFGVVKGIFAAKDFVDSVKTAARNYPLLEHRIDTLETVVAMEQASQGVILCAILKNLYPETADTIIEDAERMKKVVKDTLERQKAMRNNR